MPALAAYFFYQLKHLKPRGINNPNQNGNHTDQQPTSAQVLFFHTKLSFSERGGVQHDDLRLRIIIKPTIFVSF